MCTKIKPELIHTGEWTDLNEYLRSVAKSKHNIIGAVSNYDVEYIKYYTGLEEVFHLPSLTSLYMNASLYESAKSAKNNSLLIFKWRDSEADFVQEVKASLQGSDFSAEYVYDVYEKYTPEDLVKHRAVITLPYSVMSYRLLHHFLCNC